MGIQAAPANKAMSGIKDGNAIIQIATSRALTTEKINSILGIALKMVALLVVAAFLPSIINELTWLYKGKKVACAKVGSEYEALVMSSTGLNTRAFAPGDGSAINQAFLGTVLASSTQSPNSKLIQAAIYGCGTNAYTLQQTSW